MKKVLFLLAAAASFAVVPFADQAGAAPGALILVALGCALAMTASGMWSAISAGAGAVGAFASGVLASTSPAAAGAVLVGLCFAERTLRVRGSNSRLLHLGIAVGAGAIAGSLSTAFQSASLTHQVVAAVVAAFVAALPLLLDADDPLAHSLDQAAQNVSEPAKKSLQDAAELRRNLDEDVVEKREAKKMHRTWSALERLAQARVRLERAGAKSSDSERAKTVTEMVDRRIAEHLAALNRAYTAADTAKAAEAGLDDGTLRDVEGVGDELEEVSRVLVEDA